MIERKIIALVGASGVGKTYLARQLKECLFKSYVLPGKAFLEPEWSELPEYVQYAFRTQTNLREAHEWFRKQAVSQLVEAREIKNEGGVAILDTFLQTNVFYAEAFLKGQDKKDMIKQLQADLKTLPWPDVIVYLKAGPNYRYHRQKQRSNDHELGQANKQGNAIVGQKIDDFFSDRKDTIVIDRESLELSDPETIATIMSKIQGTK